MPERRPIADGGHRTFVFGDFELDVDRGELRHLGRPIPLRPKSFEVLRILAENPGRLLTRRELLDAAWGRRAISDDCLSQCLVDIRKALGDRSHEKIRTVPRRGYILELPVTAHALAVASGSSTREPGARIAPPLALTTVMLVAAAMVFLALENSPAEHDQRSRSMSAPASDAQAELRLAEHFYQRRGPGDLELAERHYRAALAQDSSLAEAWVGLAAISGVRIDEGLIAERDGLAVMGPAVRRALALAPGMAEAHLRACCYYQAAGQPETAAAHCDTAPRLEPDNPLVLTVAAGRAAWAGRLEKSIDLWSEAVRLEPRNATTRWNLAYFLAAAGRLDEAEDQLQRVTELRPDEDGKGRTQLATLWILQGRAGEALELLETLPRGPADRDKALAMAYHAVGREADARAALSRLLESAEPGTEARVAEVHAWRGDTEQALAWLALAGDILADGHNAEPGDITAETIRFSPILRPLHDEPGWRATVALAAR